MIGRKIEKQGRWNLDLKKVSGCHKKN